MSNHKTNGILLAKQMFIEDLKQDQDFIEFKKRARTNDGTSYGTIIAAYKVFIIELGLTAENLISSYQKSLK